MTLATVRKEIKSFPVDDRLQLLDDIWFSLADDGFLPLTEDQKNELDRRWADYKAHPETSLTVGQMNAQVTRKLKAHRAAKRVRRK